MSSAVNLYDDHEEEHGENGNVPAGDQQTSADDNIAIQPTCTSNNNRKSRAGRRPSAVWEFFTPLRTEQNKVHATCNFCARRCAGVAARMVQHLVHKCALTPREVALALDEASALKKRKVMSDTPPALGSAMTTTPSTVDGSRAISTSSSALKQQTEHDGQLSHLHISHIPLTSSSARFASSAGGAEVSDVEVAQVHEKLVLACLLNDIPVSFVEDEALMDAFAALHPPGLPRLSREVAITVVVPALHSTVCRIGDETLARSESITLICRHGAAPGTQEWLALNERRLSMMLSEVSTTSGVVGIATVGESACLSLESVLTMIREQRQRMKHEGAIVNLCCEFAHIYYQLRQNTVEHAQMNQTNTSTHSPTLFGTCLLRQSFVLREKLLRLAPSVVELLEEAATMVHSLTNLPQGSNSTFLVFDDILSECNQWSFVSAMVKRLISQEQSIRGLQGVKQSGNDSNDGIPPPRKDFWEKLKELDALLAPFNWIFALSEGKAMTSGQYMMLWIWLLSIVEMSALISTEAKQKFARVVVDSIRLHCDDHHLACMLLDPRVRGVGLSPTGKRKAKAVVVQVAQRTFPKDQFDVIDSTSRAQLLAQLGNYTEKAGQFTDEIAWEMSAGKAPEVFWKDFAQDAKELSKVARAVLTFVPAVQTATEYMRERAETAAKRSSQSNTTWSSAWNQTFAVRQIKHYYQKNPKREDDLVARYAQLLFPTEIRHMKSQHHPSTAAITESKSSSITLEVILERVHLLALSADIHDACNSSTASAATTVNSAIDSSWFAFQSSSDRQELEQAIKRFLILPSSAVVI